MALGYRRWSNMPLGRPCSQACGVLQGRSDTFSDSVLAQPPRVKPARTSNRRNAQRKFEKRPLTTRGGRE